MPAPPLDPSSAAAPALSPPRPECPRVHLCSALETNAPAYNILRVSAFLLWCRWTRTGRTARPDGDQGALHASLAAADIAICARTREQYDPSNCRLRIFEGAGMSAEEREVGQGQNRAALRTVLFAGCDHNNQLLKRN